MTPLTDAEILTAAANYLATNGWIQYQFVEDAGDKQPACCAYAAIHHYARERTLAICRRVEKVTGEPVVIWNDRPAQTAENVIRTLRSVAGSPR